MRTTCAVKRCAALAAEGADVCTVHQKRPSLDPTLDTSGAKCEDCGGDGQCAECDGNGEMDCYHCGHPTDCEYCDDGKCRACKGSGHKQGD